MMQTINTQTTSRPHDEIILDVQHLCKSFKQVRAVNELTFQVRRGEILGLLGPNGAGKTTTIQMILGLVTPSCGQIRVFGFDLTSHRQTVLQKMNFSSSYVQLPFNLTVFENLFVFARLYGVRHAKQKIIHLLDLFELGDIGSKRTGTLSSGQLTRLHLCKAFLNDPELLLLDEPTASLDPDIAEKVRSILKTIQKEKGTTIVYTSHNMFEVEQLCDRILFLHRGEKIAFGTPADIIKMAGTRNLEEFFIRISRGHHSPVQNSHNP